MLDFAPTEKNGCALTEANISKMALLACCLIMRVIARLILTLGAMPIALLNLGVCMPVYMAFTMTLRCPACRQRLLIESRGLKHPAALKQPHFGHWGRTVIDIVPRHQFVCRRPVARV